MFFGKKKKISAYLAAKRLESPLSSFDLLLQDSLSGELKDRLEQLGLKKIDIHIDWLPDYRCIGIQGRLGNCFSDIQIEPSEFSVCCDEVEPDDPVSFPLESIEQFYAVSARVFESR